MHQYPLRICLIIINSIKKKISLPHPTPSRSPRLRLLQPRGKSRCGRGRGVPGGTGGPFVVLAPQQRHPLGLRRAGPHGRHLHPPKPLASPSQVPRAGRRGGRQHLHTAEGARAGMWTGKGDGEWGWGKG